MQAGEKVGHGGFCRSGKNEGSDAGGGENGLVGDVEDVEDLQEGDEVRITSRRGTLVAPVRFDSALRPGLVFLSVHAHDVIATNDLTIDAVDPKSGTAEFKATAIRIEKV